MTEYWVSKAKHYCNYCKVWTQGDKVSIKRHEEGMGHKAKMEHFLKNRRSSKPAGEPNLETMRQIAEIERAAAGRMAETAANPLFAGSVTGFTAPQLTAGVPRHGKNTYPGMAGGWTPNKPAGWAPPENVEEEDTNAADEEAGPGDDDNAEYEIRGVKYFQGKRHIDKFRTNHHCELWVEAEERWVPATIAKVRRYSKGDGEEVRKYDVRLEPEEVPDSKPDGTPLTRLERHLAKEHADGKLLEDVKVADLRVKGDADGTWRPHQIEPGRAPAESGDLRPPPPEVDRDANTGIGGWQTVAVREYDEEEEQAEVERQEAKRQHKDFKRLEREERKKSEAADRAKFMCDQEESREMMNSQLKMNDRTDMYRGIKLSDDADEPLIEPEPVPKIAAAAADSAEASSTAAPVFKKRKINSKFRKAAA